MLRWAFLKYIQENQVTVEKVYIEFSSFYERGDLLEDGESNLYVYLGSKSKYHLMINNES
jgi:hypothetical protein